MSINQGDRVHILTKDPQLAYLDNHIATVTHSDRRGYYLQVDGIKPAVHLSNLQGMECLNRLTSAQELALDLPSQVYDPNSGWRDLPKKTNSAPKYSNLDTPELQTMATSNNGKRGRGRPRKDRSISLPPALPVNPSLTKETALDNKTPEIVYPTSEASLKKSNLRTGRFPKGKATPTKTSPGYSASTVGDISENFSNGLTSAGMTVNGSLLAQDILEPPILESDYLFLESPGALEGGTSGANPPGQNKLESQLREIGSIDKKEVSNPEFLEASLGLPVGWTDPQEEATAMELLAEMAQPENAAKPSEISLIPESPNSPSIASSTTPKRSLSEAEVQLDLTTRIAWIDTDQLEEVSYTQIRYSVDNEAIARYAELMRDNLWDFSRNPLPVLFEHENRLLIGDGHHRIEAARKHNLKIKCEIFTAWSIEDALLYSIRAIENLNHGIPLRPKDQRKRITMFLDLLDQISIPLPEGYQEWSSRAIATYLRLPESGYRTVASIRKERIRATEEPLESWGITLPDIDTTTADTFTPPSIDTPADTYTPLSTFTPVNTTFQPSFIPADMPPLPTPPARLAAMVEVILEKIDELNHEQFIELKEAIEAEEVRRLGKILEEELVLSEVEVKGSN